MANIPEKCSRCRAPIDWDDGAAFTKCEFCGFKNYLTNYDQTKIYKDSKKFKISSFKNLINNRLLKNKTFFNIIIASIFTSIAIPFIRNYSDFIADKNEEKENTKIENIEEQIKQTAKENKSKNSFQLSKADKKKWCEYDNSNGENILGVNRCIENLETLGPKFSSISFENHKKCFPNPRNSPNLSSYNSCLEISGDKNISSLVKGIKSEDIARIDYLQLKSDWEKK